MRKSMWSPLVIALALALALTSVVVYADKPNCGPNEDEHCDHGGGEGPPPTVDITAFNFGYDPKKFITTADTITVGVTEGRHTFTAQNNLFDSGRLKAGETFEITGLGPGTYVYHCEVHGIDKMRGTIEVE